MATVTIKNIPDELYEKLKQSAQLNRRSINSEVIAIIEQMLDARPRRADEVLAEARRLREGLAVYVTEEDLRRAKNEGRP